MLADFAALNDKIVTVELYSIIEDIAQTGLTWYGVPSFICFSSFPSFSQRDGNNNFLLIQIYVNFCSYPWEHLKQLLLVTLHQVCSFLDSSASFFVFF